jgi:hypothetical protein
MDLYHLLSDLTCSDCAGIVLSYSDIGRIKEQERKLSKKIKYDLKIQEAKEEYPELYEKVINYVTRSINNIIKNDIMSMTMNEFTSTFKIFDLDNKFYRANVEEINMEGDEYTAMKLFFTLYGIKISIPFEHSGWCKCKQRYKFYDECHRGTRVVLKFEKTKYDDVYIIKDYLQ